MQSIGNIPVIADKGKKIKIINQTQPSINNHILTWRLKSTCVQTIAAITGAAVGHWPAHLPVSPAVCVQNLLKASITIYLGSQSVPSSGVSSMCARCAQHTVKLSYQLCFACKLHTTRYVIQSGPFWKSRCSPSLGMHRDRLECIQPLFSVITLECMLICSELCLEANLVAQGVGEMVDRFLHYELDCVWQLPPVVQW